MAVVTPDLIAGATTSFETLFREAFLAALNAQAWRQFTGILQSNTKTETYTWLGSTPRMAEVKGQAEISGLHSFSYTLENKTWQSPLLVERDLFEDDRLNVLQPRINQLAQEAARFPGERVMQQFESNPLAYDGVALFSNTRTIGDSANIDNMISGTGADAASFLADLSTVRGQMASFQDEHGRPINIVPDVLVVPPQLEGVAFNALNPVAGGQIDPIRPGGPGSFTASGYTVVRGQWLTDPNDWYALHVGTAQPPFIWQERSAPELEAAADPNNPQTILSNMFLWSARMRGVEGVGEPKQVVKVVNA